jgi:hypothetical protein
VIAAAVAAVTPGGPKSVVDEIPALKWINGILCSPEHTIFQNLKLCQIYSHALLTIVQLIYVMSYSFSKILHLSEILFWLTILTCRAVCSIVVALFLFISNIPFYKMTNKMQLCRIIYCSLSALHVSRDNIAHHQEHLICIYSFWFYSRALLYAAVSSIQQLTWIKPEAVNRV